MSQSRPSIEKEEIRIFFSLRKRQVPPVEVEIGNRLEESDCSRSAKERHGENMGSHGERLNLPRKASIMLSTEMIPEQLRSVT